MLDTIFGSDITLTSIDQRALPQVNENKLREGLSPYLVENGGIIDNFSFASGNVQRQFNAGSEDMLYEYVKGDGLRWQKGKIANIMTQSVERSVIESVRTDKVWFPGDHVKQPFGPGTATYTDKQVMEMIYDME